MEKFRSRKFILSLLIMLATIGLAYIGKLNGDVALVFTGLIGSYNVMQGMIDKGRE